MTVAELIAALQALPRLVGQLRARCARRALAVTDRGRIVAELTPAYPDRRGAGLGELARKGELTLAQPDRARGRRYPALPLALPQGIGVTAMLDAERDEPLC